MKTVNIFILLYVVLLIGGNLISWFHNDRLLSPITNFILIGMAFLTFNTTKK